MKRLGLIVISIFAACTLSIRVQAQILSYNEAQGMYSFEEDTAPASADSKGKIRISNHHNKFGERALEWEWKKAGAKLTFDFPIDYLAENPDPKETSISSFAFWIYSPEALEGELKISFEKKGRECCWFTYKLGFQGWRSAWVAFGRDMEGKPEEKMDRMVITGPDVKKGALWFDGITPAVFLDSRFHTPDWQVPQANAATNSHWLILNKSWNTELDIPLKEELSKQDLRDMKAVENRFKKIILEKKKAMPMAKIREIYESYETRYNADGTITGKPVFFRRYGETFFSLGIKDAADRLKENGQLMQTLNDNLFKIAVAHELTEKAEDRREIADIYCELLEHLLDQGFAAGSGLGTVHHLGYCMRNFYTSPVLMKNVLRERGMLDKVQQAMEWFSGVGEVKKAAEEPGIDIDAFNTSLMGRVASVLMLEDSPYKYAYLQAISRWVDNGFKYTEGTKACFKTDGTVYHHRKAYPAYASGGMTGAADAVWMLSRTGFAISQESHQILKEALLTMRFYCNEANWPLALSGRHPDGKGKLREYNYRTLAKAGSPDGKKEIDPELAAAFLRVTDGKDPMAAKLLKNGYVAEQAPNGTKAFGYACTMAHRNDNWLVTFAGHSRYLWATETYAKCNLYGRYLTHGSMQIQSDPVDKPSPKGSGFQVNGWDWCHIPGATAAEIPMKEMRSNVLNVDVYSGYEEMLLSDESFAGGVSHQGKYGAFGMILHEHDKYNGSLRAHKSYFAFGNRIVALGSDIENRLEGSETHTTLFQNSVTADQATTINGIPFKNLEWGVQLNGYNILQDQFGHAWFVKDGEVVVSRKLQHSLHEETDAPTEGTFEKAYIRHGGLCGKDIGNCKDSYEYMTLIHATKEQMDAYRQALPYEVLRCDRQAHIVKDLPSGVIACAAFEETGIDEVITKTSPAMVMYSIGQEGMTLSVSNPDLALYEGPSDEKFDAEGKRIERSVYSREWLNNPCGQTEVRLELEGHWTVVKGLAESVEGRFDAAEPEGRAAGKAFNRANGAHVETSYSNGRTLLTFKTAEARTEEVVLKRD